MRRTRCRPRERRQTPGWRWRCRQAAEKGCVIVEPGARELFLDIDCEEDLDLFRRNVLRVQEDAAVLRYEVRSSPSGRGGRYHVVVTLGRDVDPVERVLLQALLGSDRVREALSWIRARRGFEMPTIFFEKPGDPGEPIQRCEVADETVGCGTFGPVVLSARHLGGHAKAKRGREGGDGAAGDTSGLPQRRGGDPGLPAGVGRVR
jgi:hypothetical protein